MLIQDKHKHRFRLSRYPILKDSFLGHNNLLRTSLLIIKQLICISNKCSLVSWLTYRVAVKLVILISTIYACEYSCECALNMIILLWGLCCLWLVSFITYWWLFEATCQFRGLVIYLTWGTTNMVAWWSFGNGAFPVRTKYGVPLYLRGKFCGTCTN